MEGRAYQIQMIVNDEKIEKVFKRIRELEYELEKSVDELRLLMPEIKLVAENPPQDNVEE